MNWIDIFLVACFLFFAGSILGWCLEVVFRRLFTAKKWINPGFLTGPYLPLYGFGVVGLFFLSRIPLHTGMVWLDSLLLILIMGACMTLIEYIAGLIFIKGMHIRLWDYSNRWGNVQGIICPLFSFFWLVVAAVFYFVFTKPILDAVVWFVSNLEFAFVVGIFMGVMLVDLGHSLNLSAKIRKFAKENALVVHFERLKESVRDKIKESSTEKGSFVFPFKSPRKLKEELETYRAREQQRRQKDGK